LELQTYKIIAFNLIESDFVLNLYRRFNEYVKKGYYGPRYAKKDLPMYNLELKNSFRKTTEGLIFQSYEIAKDFLCDCEDDAVIVGSEMSMKSAISPEDFKNLMIFYA